MKKFLVLLGTILIGTCAFAEEVYVIRGVNFGNFWKKKGIDEEKVLSVGQKIMLDNKIPKRVPIFVVNNKSVNASANLYDKTVTINSGAFLYIDNDDELAYVLAHEIAHVLHEDQHYYNLNDGTANSGEASANIFAIKLLQKYCKENDYRFDTYYKFAQAFGIPKHVYYLLKEIA